MPKQPITIGLASFGLSSQVFHAPYIANNQDFELKYIVERNYQNSQKEYPTAIILTSFEELIAQKDLQIIVVNTPTYLHYSMAKAALLAGKHVVLEKPMAANYPEAEELVKIAKKQNLVLAVYHNRRLESGFKTMLSLIENNSLGQISYFKSHFNRNKPLIGPKKWKEEAIYAGAGIYHDLAPHLLDQVFMLFGEPISITKATKKQRENTQIDDYFLLKLHYPHNLLVELEAGMIAKSNEPKYLLKGSLGIYTKQLEDHQEDSLRQGIYPTNTDPNFGNIQFKTGEVKSVPNKTGSYSDFYTNLAAVLNNKTQLIIRPSQALKVMKWM